MTDGPWKDRLAHRPLLWLSGVAAALLTAVVGLHLTGWTQDLRLMVQQSTEEANKTLTRVFVNESWDRVRPLLPAPGSGADAARANPRVPEIDELVRRFSRTTDILKVKIYDLDGTTVYSSDPAQIGENKSRNPGFLASTRGQVASELTRRGTFGSFDGELYQRDLVSTYVPVRVGDRIEAVLEIYADRTASIAYLNRIQSQQVWSLAPPFAGALVLLLVAGVLLQRLHARRAPGGGGSAQDASGTFDRAATAIAWMPGADDPIARAAEELNLEIAALKSGSDTRDPSRPDAIALGRAQALAEDIQTWVRTVADFTALREAGSPSSRSETYSLDELLEALAAIPARRAGARGVQLSIYKYPVTLGQADGDPARLASLLGHLLGVSVAATRSGRIELKAMRTPGGLRIDLVDSSPGWPQDMLDRLAAGWDSGSLPVPAEAGLDGLRLVLCRALAQALGGHADFRSTPGHGSRLSVELPLEAARVRNP